MKIRVKKEFPGVPVGTVFEANKSRTAQYELSLGKEYISIEIDLTEPSEWFEVVDENPVWSEEVWKLHHNNLGVYLKFGEEYLGLNPEAEKRAKLIAAAPDLWRFVKKLAEETHSVSVEVNFEAKELLKKIES